MPYWCMPADSETLPFPGFRSSAGTILVNDRCQIVGGAESRVVMYAGVPVLRMAPGDREAEDLFIAQALENGFAKPGELSRALGRPIRTVHRVHLRYVRGGVSGVVLQKRGPKGPRLGEVREAVILRLRREGMGHAGIARSLGVGKAVRRQLFFPINDNYFYRSGSGAGLPVPPFSAVRGVWARST